MMTYSTLSTQTRPFLAMTGLTPAEFRDLLPAFEAAYERACPLDRTADGRTRKWLSLAGEQECLALEAAAILARDWLVQYLP